MTNWSVNGAHAVRPLISVLMTSILVSCGAMMDDQGLVRRATEALDRHAVAEAVPDLNSALQKNPSNVTARVLLARARIESGDLEAAADLLRIARESGAPATLLDPWVCRLAQERGNFEEALKLCVPSADLPSQFRADMLASRSGAALGAGNPAQAEVLAREALRLDSRSARGELALALALLKLQNLKAAQPAFDKAVALNTSDPRAWLALGQARLASGDLIGAERDFRQAVLAARSYQHGFARLAGYLGLIDTQLRQNDPAKAVETASELVAWSPNNALAARAQGRALLAADKPSEARLVLEKAVAAAPDDGWSRLLLSAAHEKLGNIQQAEAQLTSLTAQDPNNPVPRRALAELRLRGGRYDAALEALTPLLGGPTVDPVAVELASRIGAVSGDMSSVIRILESSATRDPKSPGNVLALAQIYLRVNRVEDAANALMKLPAGASRNAREALLAITALRRGQVSAALDLATTVVDDHATSTLARGIAISVLASPALSPAGTKALEKLAADESNGPQPRVALAGVAGARGDYVGALSYFEAALKLAPDDRSALSGYAQMAVRAGKVPQAVSVLKAAIERAPTSPEPVLLLAGVYVASGDSQAAKSLTEKALERFPREPAVMLQRAAALIAASSPTDAITVLRRAVDLSPLSVDPRLALARAQMLAGDVRSARQTRSALVTTLREATPAVEAAARLAIEAKDFDDAERYIGLLARREPRSASHIVLRAELAASKGDFVGAADEFSRAQKVAPTLDLVMREIAASRQAGSVRLEPLMRYVAANPEDGPARKALATIYMEIGDLQSARREYEAIVRREPDNGLVLNNLAWVCAELGDSSAVGLAKRAAALLPGRGDVLDTLGFALMQQGEVAAAVATLREAVRLQPGDPSIRHRLALAYEANGQTAEAATTLKELLSTSRNYAKRSEAERMLSRLAAKGA